MDVVRMRNDQGVFQVAMGSVFRLIPRRKDHSDNPYWSSPQTDPAANRHSQDCPRYPWTSWILSAPVSYSRSLRRSGAAPQEGLEAQPVRSWFLNESVRCHRRSKTGGLCVEVSRPE